MSIEFFKTIRQQSVAYALPKKFLLELSRVIADLELFNREVDFDFENKHSNLSFGGNIGNDHIEIDRSTKSSDIGQIINAANKGVKASLKSLMKIALDKLGEEEYNDEED